MNLITADIFIPGHALDSGCQREMGPKVELVNDVFEIALQLDLLGVSSAPVERFERIRIKV